jgi:hypothetical protein
LQGDHSTPGTLPSPRQSLRSDEGKGEHQSRKGDLEASNEKERRGEGDDQRALSMPWSFGSFLFVL